MDGLTESQERALAALLSAPTRTAAATMAGITPRTLQRYLRSEPFRQRYREALTTLSEDARRRLAANMAAAANTLAEIQNDNGQPAAVRVAAARAILDHGERMAIYGELAERVEQLEQVNNNA